MKPDWKDAPEWANWLSMDYDGEWYWFKDEPRLTRNSWVGCDIEDKCDFAGKSPTPETNVWEYTLEARPLGIETPEEKEELDRIEQRIQREASDGSTASYYELPEGATELYHLIIHKNMNAQLGEIFRAAYRYGESSHSDQLRDARKIKAYIEQEIERLEKRCIG